MTLPPAYHLPGWRGGPATRRIGATTLRVPDLVAVEVESVSSGLRDAARVLRAETLQGRVSRVASVCEQLRRSGPRDWRTALVASTGLSPAGLDAAWDVTFAPLSAEALHEALARESLDDAILAQSSARVPEQILHVLAGNVLAPTVQMLVRGWLLGAAQWLRPASREPLFAACVCAQLDDIAPELAACTAVLWWPHASETEAAVVRASPTITVQGDDASVEGLRLRVGEVRPNATFVGYGSRWSCALLSASALHAANATALVRDVSLFDQQGCLSPTYAFVQRTPQLETWCNELAAAFSALESRMPRGRPSAAARAGLRHWHETTRLKQVLGSVQGFWEDSIRWGVALAAAPDALDTPLDRHLVVVPFDSIQELQDMLAPRARRLQGVAFDLEGWEPALREQALGVMRPSRAAAVGSLQLAPPAWPQDHKPPLGSLWGRGRNAAQVTRPRA